MNRKQRNRIIGVVVLIVIVGIVYWVLIGSRICCALPPTPPPSTSLMEADGKNATVAALLNQTTTSVFKTALASIITATTTSYPYDPTLYAQRRHEEQILQTAAGPDDYATFYAEETAIVATYQGTVLPTSTPIVVEMLSDTSSDPLNTAISVALTQTQRALSTPIPYTADMSPTAIPNLNTRTATPTLCPPSDVVCPGGNATMSPADKVMVLMASASAPEFGQLAQTATALAITPTPNPTSFQCAWSWAHRDLPDTAQAVQVILVQKGLSNVHVVRADAFGEECGNSDRADRGFGAMTTDFYLSIEVANLNDADAAAKIITDTYTILSTLDIELPAQPGYLDMTFTSGSQSKRFRAMFDTIKPIIEGKKGAKELLAAGDM